MNAVPADQPMAGTMCSSLRVRKALFWWTLVQKLLQFAMKKLRSPPISSSPPSPTVSPWDTIAAVVITVNRRLQVTDLMVEERRWLTFMHQSLPLLVDAGSFPAIRQSSFKLYGQMLDFRWVIRQSWWSAEGCEVASLRLSRPHSWCFLDAQGTPPSPASWLQLQPVLQQHREAGSELQMWSICWLFPQSSDNWRKKGKNTAVSLGNGLKEGGISS